MVGWRLGALTVLLTLCLCQAHGLGFAPAGYMDDMTYIISYGSSICVKSLHDCEVFAPFVDDDDILIHSDHFL